MSVSPQLINKFAATLQQVSSLDREAESLPLTRYSALLSLSRDVDSARRVTYRTNTDIDRRMHTLDKKLEDLLFEAQYELKSAAVRSVKATSVAAPPAPASAQNDSELRRRLLATNSRELDSVQNAEDQNDYLENLQQSLLDSLPSMVAGVKDQALQFQDMLRQDAAILKEASENFERSHGKFGVVSDMLAKYHKEGKLGIFFYIRVIAMVLVTFLFLVFLIRLIPERH